MFKIFKNNFIEKWLGKAENFEQELCSNFCYRLGPSLDTQANKIWSPAVIWYKIAPVHASSSSLANYAKYTFVLL